MKKIIVIFFIWRFYLFLIAATAPLILPTFQERFPYFQERLIDTNLPHFIWSFGNFDGVHYIGIAQSGYSAQFTQVFFPLYPISIKIVSSLIHLFLSEKTSLLLSGLIISNLSFLTALFVFHKFIKNIFSESVAFWSILFLVFFPTSFYFGSVYSESLFFLLVISAYYWARSKIILASILGTLASATRLIGVFLAPTLTFNHGLKKAIPLIIVSLGVLSYMLYLWIEFKEPFYFVTGQSVFGNERSSTTLVLLPQVLFRYFKILITTQDKELLLAIFELLSTLTAFLVLFLALKVKKIKKEWIVFSFLSLILPTLTGTLSSMPRYVLVAFPVYIYLSLIKNNLIKIFILSVFIILLTVFTAFFTQGYWLA